MDYHASQPVILEQANLRNPFVYDREYGLFYVPYARHVSVMATLYAFHRGFADYADLAEYLGIGYNTGLSDRFLKEIEGTCYRSSQSIRPVAGKFYNLNDYEREIFGDVAYLFEGELP